MLLGAPPPEELLASPQDGVSTMPQTGKSDSVGQSDSEESSARESCVRSPRAATVPKRPAAVPKLSFRCLRHSPRGLRQSPRSFRSPLSSPGATILEEPPSVDEQPRE